MSNWFADKLGISQPTGAVQPARRVGGGVPLPSGRAYVPAAVQYQQQYDNAPPPASLEEALRRGITHKQDQLEHCPNCNSGNLFLRLGKHRCYDCGWPLLQGLEGGRWGA